MPRRHDYQQITEHDTLLCQTSFASVDEESVQVHFAGKNSWVCSSSISGYVRVYDSATSKNLTSSGDGSPVERMLQFPGHGQETCG